MDKKEKTKEELATMKRNNKEEMEGIKWIRSGGEGDQDQEVQIKSS